MIGLGITRIIPGRGRTRPERTGIHSVYTGYGYPALLEDIAVMETLLAAVSLFAVL